MTFPIEDLLLGQPHLYLFWHKRVNKFVSSNFSIQ